MRDDDADGSDWHGMLMNGTQYMDGVPGISQVSTASATHGGGHQENPIVLIRFQCPIPAGGSFTYNFTITNQYGSYWCVFRVSSGSGRPSLSYTRRWHSHYGNTMADGLVGGLIVHSVNDPLKLGQDYDEERVLMLADWVWVGRRGTSADRRDVLSDTVVAELAGGGFDGVSDATGLGLV
jgi:hypothetical protein